MEEGFIVRVCGWVWEYRGGKVMVTRALSIRSTASTVRRQSDERSYAALLSPFCSRILAHVKIGFVLVTVLLMWKDTMTKATLKEERIWLRPSYCFRCLFSYYSREYGCRHKWCWRNSWAFHPDLQAERQRDWAWRGLLKPQSSLPVTHILQQGHTS